MTTRITCWPSLYRPGDGRRVSLRALLARVVSPKAYATKEAIGRWSWGSYRDGYRSLASFVSTPGLAIDLDSGASRDDVLRAFGDLCGFAHTTWSHVPECGRWRIGILLSRPVDRDEHDRVWRALASVAERAGIAPDYSGRDACHCWALPAIRPHYEHADLTGAPFDVDEALARFPAPEPLPEPDRHHRGDDLAHRIERASKYLGTMPGAIAGSGGHLATFLAAVVLVRGFDLPPDDALRLLAEEFNPRCAPAWSTWELRHKVRQAIQRGRLPAGYLADRVLP